MCSENAWSGDFGRSYADRNNMTSQELDRLYERNFRVSRSSLNAEFLAGINTTSTMLEVGCNRGLQLELLRDQGFKSLYGFDISEYAIRRLDTQFRRSNIVRSSAVYFPFRNESFDVVFSSGVLIHIPPEELMHVIDEMYRCSKRYIWCYEYYEEKETEVPYRGKRGLLWKNNFLRVFTHRFPDLSVTRTRKLDYTYNQNADIMFLLEKRVQN